jgi:RNA polymerase sigma-70 factor (ECF subfamily)
MNNDELKDLIFKIASSKDKIAFGKVFDYFAPKIMGYLISSGTQKEISEEITQEVLIKVWQKASQFNKNIAYVSTWIFTIARNQRIDWIRKNENPSYNTVDLLEALYPNYGNESKEMKNNLVEILSILNKNEKNLIKMNFFQGKNHKIIAQELEIPLGTVKSRIRNIIKKMKNL